MRKIFNLNEMNCNMIQAFIYWCRLLIYLLVVDHALYHKCFQVSAQFSLHCHYFCYIVLSFWYTVQNHSNVLGKSWEAFNKQTDWPLENKTKLKTSILVNQPLSVFFFSSLHAHINNTSVQLNSTWSSFIYICQTAEQ